VHAINIGKNTGWKLSEMIEALAQELTAKEVVSLEGVGSPNPGNKVFYYATQNGNYTKKLSAVASPLSEGIVVGVTGALLARNLKVPVVAFFAEAQSGLPDSRAAAEIIKALDAYTGLKIDPKPLLQQAKMFEQKLKGILDKSGKAEEVAEEKRENYFG
jgi:predicted ATP-grasp superfamily ATP-dependent carboligase